MMTKQEFLQRKIAVIGLGKSGFAAAKFLASKKARVRATEGSERPEALENASYLRGMGIEVETGRHTADFLSGAECLVTSPGVPKDSVPLAWARKNGVPVISEVELASYFCRGRIVAVTGSNGKTTTCHLIHRMLTDAGKKSVLCGNVGYSFLNALPEIDAKTIVVLELSSFQLEDSPRLKPAVAVLLNVTPNHLDRHKTFESYAAAKAKIFANQVKSDRLVANRDDKTVRELVRTARATVLSFGLGAEAGYGYSQGHLVERSASGREKRIAESSRIQLKGDHNRLNAAAAAAAVRVFGVTASSIEKTLSTFNTLEHRIELLGSVRGVTFVNDSKSTTVDSTRAAIEAVPSPLILIAGGRDKGSDFSAIAGLVTKKVKRVVLYGEAREKIASSLSGTAVVLEPKFADAFRAAFEAAAPGDTILLSPMCASFDQFNSFEQRGETFKRLFENAQSASLGTGRLAAH